jgi:hypothetical protein
VRATVAGDVSSQFLSGLLLVAPYAQAPVELVVERGLNAVPGIRCQPVAGAMYAFPSIKFSPNGGTITVSVTVVDNSMLPPRIPDKSTPIRRSNLSNSVQIYLEESDPVDVKAVMVVALKVALKDVKMADVMVGSWVEKKVLSRVGRSDAL